MLWVLYPSYYSCDLRLGYLFLKTHSIVSSYTRVDTINVAYSTPGSRRAVCRDGSSWLREMLGGDWGGQIGNPSWSQLPEMLSGQAGRGKRQCDNVITPMTCGTKQLGSKPILSWISKRALDWFCGLCAPKSLKSALNGVSDGTLLTWLSDDVIYIISVHSLAIVIRKAIMNPRSDSTCRC